MSATIGTGDCLQISGIAAALSGSGTETRERCLRRPRRSVRFVRIVAVASVVSVLVMVCTEIGASPPTGTGPTWIFAAGAAINVPPRANVVHEDEIPIRCERQQLR